MSDENGSKDDSTCTPMSVKTGLLVEGLRSDTKGSKGSELVTKTRSKTTNMEFDYISTFKGDIFYKSDGTAIVVEEQDASSLRVPQDSLTVPRKGIQFVTVFNAPTSSTQSSHTKSPVQQHECQNKEEFDSSKVSKHMANQERTDIVTLPQNFMVHCLADEESLANQQMNNNNSNAVEKAALVHQRLLAAIQDYTNTKGEDPVNLRRPVLMCFPCRLTFGIPGSLASHASSAHNIELNETEKKLLEHEIISCAIQETDGGRAVICFLEPLKDVDQKLSSGSDCHLEKVTPYISETKSSETEVEKLSTVTCKRTTDNASTREHESNHADDARMNETSPDLAQDNQQGQPKHTLQQSPPEKKTESKELDKPDSGPSGPIATPSNMSSLLKTETSIATLPAQSLAGADSVESVKRTIQTMMATASESSAKSTPVSLQASGKVLPAGKSSDSSFSGGITNVDPLFQMSLFQSRNSCKTLKCPRCNWHYKYRQTLDAHMKEKHADETSDCIYCNANQPHPRLSRGESYACGYKPFKCEVCNYSTTTKGNLSIHMQSDKHLYNVKTMQHQQQQNKDKLNRQAQSGVNFSDMKPAVSGGNAIQARFLAEKQEQLQNLIQQQTRKRSSPESSTSPSVLRGSPMARKGSREVSASPNAVGSPGRKQPWRCDVCNYETDIPRNLRIHMQSEKHANNVALAGIGGLARLQENQKIVKQEKIFEGDTPKAEESSSNMTNISPPNGNAQSALEQNPSMAALYYYLAMQSSMQPNQTGDQQVNSEEREKQQKQLLAQQQQLLLAQQYQQVLAQLTGSGDTSGSSAAFLQQHILLQQQLQLWRQLLAQNDGSQLPSGIPKINDFDASRDGANNPPSTSDKFLFTCGICCNFSCNDLESLCNHVRTPRLTKTSTEDSEWVTKSPNDGYLCRICNYSTQLKTNFSLHCKTEKHTSKLQLINHIREGGEANECKVSYAIAGSNMNKVACNGCRHSSTSIDKLKIHCSTDRHQGTLTMCHYLDTMLKESEMNKGLKFADGPNSHHLLCRPCSYQSKFVVGMIQHMQCQSHQAKVQEEQQKRNVSPTDIVVAEVDREWKSEEDLKATAAEGSQDEVALQTTDSEMTPDSENESQVHKCQLCEYETSEVSQLQLHLVSQHGLSSIKCPMCPDYLPDTNQFQMHLIDVHKLASRETDGSFADNSKSDAMEGTDDANGIQLTPIRKKVDQSELAQGSNTINSEVHDEISHIHDGATTSIAISHGCTNCEETFPTAELLRNHVEKDHQNENTEKEQPPEDDTLMASEDDYGKRGSDLSFIFSDQRLLLTTLCTDTDLAVKVMKDERFAQAWEILTPPFSCSTCEETFLKKSDLHDHLMTSRAHKAPGAFQNYSSPPGMESRESEITAEAGTRDQTNHIPLDNAKGKLDEPHPEESAETQGISKTTHKEVLVDVGFDQVAHFVENRSTENRQRAKSWKNNNAEPSEGEVGGNNNEVKLLVENVTAATHSENKVSPSPGAGQESLSSTCERCGKAFSNTWILRVHEKSVHNVEMSPEMLEEFIQGYTSWYWDCVKNDADTKDMEKENASLSHPENASNPQACDTSDSVNQSTLLDEGVTSGDDKGFRQAAMQALLKNYPGLLSSYGGLSHQPGNDEQSKAQQQQLVLQMLMTAQAQSALQQQQQRQQQAASPAQSQSPGPGNPSNIMNMLFDHLYGAAVHGATPGFMDPMGVMALLQQQQQSRLPGPAGMNTYHWLAMRYLQQQQMQQFLMYPAMAAGNAPLPFMPNIMDNSNQQQMLAALASSLLSPGGLSQDPTASMMNNPLASALHAYQLQAATASLSEGRAGVKDSEPDPSKIIRMHQRDSSINPPQHQQTEIPAKRPRTRITDDQLKILRSNFDINTSPSEDQIAEMALKTNLPPKVIKHWFRNTLFKERQRSKDSPYNFNIPPITSLDDINTDSSVSANNAGETSASSYSKGSDSGKMIHLNQTPERRLSDQESSKQSELNAASVPRLPSHSVLTDNDTMKFLKSLSDNSSGNSDTKQSLFSNPMSYLPGLNRVSDIEKANVTGLTHATDLSRRGSSGSHKEVQQFGYNRANSHPPTEFSYSPIPAHGSVSAITRRTPRTRFSDYQLKVLQEFFDKNAYPKDEDLDKLSRMLELSTRVIVVWFQNARQKARKSYEMQQGAMTSSLHPNGLPALANYARKRQSPPTSPDSLQQQKLHGASSSNGSSTTVSKNFAQFSRDFGSLNNNGNTAITVKKEEEESSSENNFKCLQCDATFPTADALQQHEKLHPSYVASVMQQYKMRYPPSVIEGMIQGSGNRDFKENISEVKEEPSKSPGSEERRPSQEDVKHVMTSQANHAISDLFIRFGLPNSIRPENRVSSSFDSKHLGQSNSTLLSVQYQNHGDSFYDSKRSRTSPTQLSMQSASLTSPNGNRTSNIRRKGINDTSKDPKRLRTTITPEQLEFLYQQYLVDSSPSRKVIEQISDIVGLKKRVVQVWFQNTRARERKGQFRSVGRITSVLGVPQICPHCRVTFRTKADLDAHVRYRHMQSPSAVAISMMSQSQKIASNDLNRKNSRSAEFSGSSLTTTPTVTREKTTLNVPTSKPFDYSSIFSSLSKQIKEKCLAESEKSLNAFQGSNHSATSDPPTQNASDSHPSSPKRRRTHDSDNDPREPFVTSPPSTKTTFSNRTAEIYKAVTEHIYGPKAQSTVNAIAQRLQGKVAVPAQEGAERLQTAPLSLIHGVVPSNTTTSAAGNAMSPSSSPEPANSTNPFMVPLKRYRTQMSSMQVRSLKHCFAVYKTPTLMECEILGAQIGLPKRVIQVWFQNARAKEKKARQGDMQNEQMESHSQVTNSCTLCPDMRFGSHQEHRNHIFSKVHLQNFTSNCDSDGSDDQGRQTSSSDNDEYASRELLASDGQEERNSPSPPQQRYLHLPPMQKLSSSNDTAHSDSEDAGVSSSEEAFNNLRQTWMKHQQILLAKGMGGDSAVKPFEGMISNQTRTVHEAEKL